jgi:hypothetical protein
MSHCPETAADLPTDLIEIVKKLYRRLVGTCDYHAIITKDEKTTLGDWLEIVISSHSASNPISINRVMEQALASERFRATPRWVDASKWLPQGPHEVLATDGESWFVACLQGSEWWLHELDEPCDSVVTHWMELPELPQE